MARDYLEFPFEVKVGDVDESTGIFKGQGSPFGGPPDTYGDIVVQGAFKKTIEKGGRNGFGIAMLYQHDVHEPIGTWLELEENKKGLQVTGKLTKGVRRADESLLLMKDGALRGLSIGYDVPKGGFEVDDKKKVRYLKEVELWEISPVTFPAATRARITNVKAMEQAKTEREWEAVLRESGLSRNEAMYVVRCLKPYLREVQERDEDATLLSGMHAALKDINADEQIGKHVRGLLSN